MRCGVPRSLRRRPVQLSGWAPLKALLPVACLPLFLGASLHAAALAPGAPDSPETGGTLRLTASSSGGTLDPQISYVHITYQMEAIVYDGLTTFAKTPGPMDRHAIPDLVEALPAPEDGGKTYVFHLRHGIRFSNGREVTPDDVAASMRRIFRANSPTAGPYYSHIVGGTECLHDAEHCTLSGGVIPDDTAWTITFHLTHPDSEFFDRLAFQHASILPADTPPHDTGNTAPLGTGPYRIASYEPNSGLVMERNPYFRQWDAEAQPAGYPDEIRYAFGLDPEAAVTAIENNQYDWMLENVPLDRQAEIGSRFSDRVRLIDQMVIYYAALNVNLPPFNDVRVRQALNYALNRKAVVIYNGGPAVSLAACQMLPTGAPGFEPGCAYTKGASPEHPAPEWKEPDLALAKKLVAESGTAGQKVVIVTPQSGGSDAIANEIRSTLTDLGYVASVRPITPVIEFSYIQNSDNNVQVGLTGWSADYPSASSFLQTLFSCATFIPHSDNSINASQFCDHKFDALMDRAAEVSLTDRKAGDALWAEASRALMAQAPAVPLDQTRRVALMSSRLHGAFDTPIYEAIFSQMKLRRAGDQP
ncbi:ABC transporter substrate-binding protein [Acetobacter conturbans]|uniref:ABC transporter substrate-binding protein n=1 Tax=Acetobacter conturbans TaxID=1737472 RepID=A0ABX0K3K1_9PROT|nr:ABC transporter substrate-binding protein [Acetobacter conturbans]NHN88582.1 ABC transporter substrate-binding protein [Acetobacter conturbans]